MFRSRWATLLAGALSLLCLVAVYLALRETGTLGTILDAAELRARIEHLGMWGPFAVVALMALAVLVSPIPSAPIAMAAGAIYGHAWGTLYVVMGAEAGALAAFTIARMLGKPVVHRWFGERLPMRMLGSQNALTWIVFGSRLLPFVSFDLVSYAAGLTPLSAWRFALATLAGIIPTSFLLAHFGHELNGGEADVFLFTALALGLVTAVPVAIKLWRDRAPRRSAQGGAADRRMDSRPPPSESVLNWFGLWRITPGMRLPARVERALRELQRRSEILIGWVQAALVGLLGALYLVAPGTAPADAVFHPVPWALGTYGAFTLLRLILAYRNRLSFAIKILSVLVDVSMLMITIWSFHIQYGQPAAFYLKAPTLLYVYIFIVLRALTIAPGYVLFTGLVAAAGWLTLLGYAVMAPEGSALVTHDYVEYMTSAKILIGGEIDRVLSILIVTLVLSVSVARARQLLFRAIGDQAAVSQLSRFFSPEIAQRLSVADELLSPGDGEQRDAAAMFIDLRGFTTLAAALPPVELIDLLREYQRIAVPIIHRNRGSVSTYLGDGIMATFGATRSSATYCADAVRCAEQLLDALATWCMRREARNLPAPGVGIGLDAGTVTCGVIGDEARLEYAIIGDPVNRAAKLQNQTKVEGALGLASVVCHERAIAQGYIPGRPLHLLSDRSVSGVPGTMNLVVLGKFAKDAA